MRQADAEFDMLTAFFIRLGENDSHEMVRLFNRFADIAEEMNHKKHIGEVRGKTISWSLLQKNIILLTRDA